jgi:hypothetical protein
MGFIGEFLRREKAGTQSAAAAAPAETQAVVSGPQLMLLLPDAAGIASHQFISFPHETAAEMFVDSALRGNLPTGAVFFWALMREPDDVLEVEPLVLIRDTFRGNVYPFSFARMEDAFAFVRHEMKRGLELAHVFVCWAVSARLEPDFWGRSSIVPSLSSLSEGEHGIQAVENVAGAAQVIQFQVASERMRNRTAGLRAWRGFALGLEEALDASVARTVAARLAWQRIAVAVSVAAHRAYEEDSARKEATVRAWGNVASALSGAAYTADLARRASAARVWGAAVDGVTSALHAERKRRETYDRCWLNAATALADAIEARGKYTDRARAAWFSLTRALAAGAGVLAARRARAAHSWTAASAALQAAAICSSRKEAAARRTQAVAAWANATAAIRDAVTQYARRKAAGRAWRAITGQLKLAALTVAAQRTRALAAWSNATRGICHAVEVHSRREAARHSWPAIATQLKLASVTEARLRIRRASLSEEETLLVERAISPFSGRAWTGPAATESDESPRSWPTTWRQHPERSSGGPAEGHAGRF